MSISFFSSGKKMQQTQDDDGGDSSTLFSSLSVSFAAFYLFVILSGFFGWKDYSIKKIVVL